MDTAGTPAAESETLTKNTKSTKEKLDELRDLYERKYVTEAEFKNARVNILKEAGLDVITQLRSRDIRASAQEEEEESKDGGWGCSLVALFLAAFFVLGVCFFAAPYWPNYLGGDGVRAARKWITDKGTNLVDRFLGDSADSAKAPDPIAADDTRSEEDSTYTQDLSETEPQEAGAPNVTVPLPALPSLDVHILSFPSSTEEPDETVEDIQTSVSEEPIPVAPRAENTVGGYISVPIARIRSAPDTSTNDNLIGRGRSGERFIVLEEGPGTDGSKWYNVEFEDGSKRGWLKGSLLRLE